MLAFRLSNSKLIFIFHLKGGTTTFKYYLLQTFLKKEYGAELMEKEVNNINIHNTLRKYKSNQFEYFPVNSDASVLDIRNNYSDHEIIYIHRNYKERLVSGFINKFVELDDNGYFIGLYNSTCKSLNNNKDYKDLLFSEFIKLVCDGTINNPHFYHYPITFNKLKKTTILLTDLKDINPYLLKHGLPEIVDKKYNSTENTPIKLTKYKKELSIRNLQKLKEKNIVLDIKCFYNNKLEEILKNKFGHEYIL